MTACVVCGGSRSEPYFEKGGFRLARCQDCGLVAVENPPSDDELERFYSFAAGYGVESRDDEREILRLTRLAEHHVRQLSRFVSPRGRLLDVGCGAGFFLGAARDGGWSVEGVELNVDTAEVAERRGFPVHRGRLEDVRLPDGTFEVLTFWDVLEHVRDPVATVAEARRILAANGVLALSTPNLGGLFPVVSRPWGAATGYWTHPEPPAHLFQFSRRTVCELLSRGGFEVLGTLNDRSPLKYTLSPGGYRRLVESPLRGAYAAIFALPLLVGPLVRAGDEITVVARKSPA